MNAIKTVFKHKTRSNEIVPRDLLRNGLCAWADTGSEERQLVIYVDDGRVSKFMFRDEYLTYKTLRAEQNSKANKHINFGIIKRKERRCLGDYHWSVYP